MSKPPSALSGARRLSLGQQTAVLKTVWPMLDCTNSRGHLRCTGRLRPSPLGALYRVRIEYEPPSVPRVYVLDPQLEPRVAGGTIPHTYAGPRPCLFFPGYGDEWRSSRYIAHTIVPWLLLWLHHYESWHVTGIWQGGGIEHSPSHGNAKTEDDDERID